LRKRGVFVFEQSLVSNSKNTEATSLVCDICFMMILAEDELIDIEKQFASILNIPANLTKGKDNNRNKSMEQRDSNKY
jgi:hypothetical protein